MNDLNLPCPDVQIIKQAGRPAFAVVPYDEYLVLMGANHSHVPKRVLDLQISHNISRVGAWRLYRGISQRELSERLGMVQSTVARLERPDVKPRNKTLERLSLALGCSVEQLLD